MTPGSDPGRGPGGGKVLVLGDDTRSFLAVVRSLARQDIAVHAAPLDFQSPALASRYIARINRLPYWIGDGAEWLAAMDALLEAERFDLVIPCNETALLPLQAHRARFEARTRLAMPDDATIAVLFDKHATRELARGLGVPVAPGRLLTADDTAAGILAEFGTPVAVKPRRSYRLDRLYARGKVEIAGDAAALAALLAGIEPETHLVEGFVPGHGAGVSVLASGGRLLQAFEHHRVHETTAGSYYRVSALPTPALRQACADIMGALGATGIAMFEFRIDDATGRWVLFEVNARPWGSLPLPVGLGVDFPYRWHRLLVRGEETIERPYRAGVYGRNFFPDFEAMLAEARPLIRRPGRFLAFVGGRLREYGRALSGRELHDVFAGDDRAPGWREARQFAGRAALRLGRRLPGAAGRAQARERRALRRALAAPGPVGIAFVCQGNICRSPFAAALLRRLAPEIGRDVAVSSSGMMPQAGRASPPLAVAAAARQGIDLAGHRSTHLTPEAAAAARVIVVFDEENRRAVFRRYPDIAAPVIKLALVAGMPAPEGDIADPIDGDAAVYDMTYDRIARAVTALAALLKPTLDI